MLRERRRSLAKVGVFEAPRVKLGNGFFNTIGKTDLFAGGGQYYRLEGTGESFIQGGGQRPVAN
jgi:hypothetical protein